VTEPRLGLRPNAAQFSILVAITLFVGGMVGLERSTLPLVGESEFGLGSTVAVLSFIASFGAAKALTNLAAGPLAARAGRKRLLVAGWIVAVPVPILILDAPSWAWVVGANALLGLNQGLTWSMAVVMKVDLAGPRRRGLALGLNEAAGYGGVAIGAAVAGIAAAELAPRDVIAVGGLTVALTALLASLLLVRDTAGHVAAEQGTPRELLGLRASFRRVTIADRTLRSCSQAGFVNNLNDGLMWGIGPLFLAAHGAGYGEIGLVAGLYPAVWGVGQIATGWLSDEVGRKAPIVAGMLLQAAALVLLATSGGAVAIAACAAVLLGIGTALVYPTLLATISDRVEPVDRPTSLGVYRFWRDTGYVAGAIVAGTVAEAWGLPAAIAVVAGLTALSGLVVALEMGDVGDRGRVGADEQALTGGRASAAAASK